MSPQANESSPLVNPTNQDTLPYLAVQNVETAHSANQSSSNVSLPQDQERYTLPFPSQTDASKPFRPRNYLFKNSYGRINQFVIRNQGLLLLAMSQLFFSTMNLFFKLLTSLPPEDSPRITALEIVFIRMSITWVGCVAFMLATGVQNPVLGPKGVRRLLALRGFLGFFGLFGLYYSLQFLSLADATVITFLGPLATGLLGYLALGEKFTFREAIGGFVSLSGVVLIARPAFIFGKQAIDSPLDALVGQDTIRTPYTSLFSLDGYLYSNENQAGLIPTGFDWLLKSPYFSTFNSTLPQPHDGDAMPRDVTEAQRLLAVGLALLGVCLGSGAYITIRAIGKRASATHSVAYFSLYSTIVSTFLMWSTGTKFVLPYGMKWCFLLACIGIFGLIAQILLAMGLQREKAGRAVSATYLQVVFATLYQLFFLHVPIQTLNGLGMAVILMSAAWVAAGKA